LDLLDQLSRVRSESINDLASKIGRNVKNVYMDLKKLESLGLIRLVKEGRSMIPELLVHEVTLLLW
jgi:predicted transcriptional regulator